MSVGCAFQLSPTRPSSFSYISTNIYFRCHGGDVVLKRNFVDQPKQEKSFNSLHSCPLEKRREEKCIFFVFVLYKCIMSELKLRSALEGHGNDVKCVAVVQNGLLISGSRDKTSRFWTERSVFYFLLFVVC